MKENHCIKPSEALSKAQGTEEAPLLVNVAAWEITERRMNARNEGTKLIKSYK